MLSRAAGGPGFARKCGVGRRDLSARSAWILAALGFVQATSGNRAGAARILAELEARSRDEYVRAYSLALAHLGLGNITAALDWLERAFAERDLVIVWLRLYFAFEPLHDHPRFRALMEKLGAASKGQVRV